MGLDNIPNIYPCESARTAVKVERTFSDGVTHMQIDCEATKACGGCPVLLDPKRPSGLILGMFGIDCWYRGKAGNWMLSQLEGAGYCPPGDFYGTGEMGKEEGDPDYCLELAGWMAEHAEAYAALAPRDLDAPGRQARIEEYHYAIWWLRFVAEHAEGFNTWY